jgi:hypothetical protein
MNMEQTITNGNKLFELDPQLFDRRLETHPYHVRATEEQKKKYRDSLPCAFCGHVGGSCECDPKLSRKQNGIMPKRTVTHENQREGSTNAPGYESIEEKYKTGKVSYLNDPSMTLKTLQEEFGVIAEQRGFVSPTQILEALGIPVNGNTKKEKYRFIASILYDQGFITKTQINEALDSLKMD